MIVHSPEPLLHATPISDLRPTQITVGMREVQAKRKSWKERNREDYDSFLAAHMVPAIIGPEGLRYLIDHHHLALALHKEGVERVFVSVVADLSKVDPDFFWNMMDFHGWTHPFDAKGRRRDYDALPKSVDKLKDDPYRSLAGELRNLGGFAKDSKPFSEFVWADFLRRRIDSKALDSDFEAALADALDLARSPEANYLPGWCAARTKKPKPATSAA
jgi:hypothetical protein